MSRMRVWDVVDGATTSLQRGRLLRRRDLTWCDDARVVTPGSLRSPGATHAPWKAGASLPAVARKAKDVARTPGPQRLRAMRGGIPRSVLFDEGVRGWGSMWPRCRGLRVVARHLLKIHPKVAHPRKMGSVGEPGSLVYATDGEIHSWNDEAPQCLFHRCTGRPGMG